MIHWDNVSKLRINIRRHFLTKKHTLTTQEPSTVHKLILQIQVVSKTLEQTSGVSYPHQNKAGKNHINICS